MQANSMEDIMKHARGVLSLTNRCDMSGIGYMSGCNEAMWLRLPGYVSESLAGRGGDSVRWAFH
jgi:hypothetical protein